MRDALLELRSTQQMCAEVATHTMEELAGRGAARFFSSHKSAMKNA